MKHRYPGSRPICPRALAALGFGVLFIVVSLALSACSGGRTAAQAPLRTDLRSAAASANGATTTATLSVASSATAAQTRDITTSTEWIPEPEGANPINRLMHNDAPDVGIHIYEAQGGPPKGGPPGELYLKARVAGGQDEGAYEAIAETILTLAEKYKQQIYFDQLRVVLTAEGDRVAYDHTFQVTPPTSTTSTTQASIIYYSGPSLDVSPRRGVTLKATISQYSSGAIFANVEIRNDSGSAFRFLSEDLQLYVDGNRVEQTNPGGKPMEDAGGVTQIYFNPSPFDPHLAGLVYTSSDPQSQGFTASDGPTQAQAPK